MLTARHFANKQVRELEEAMCGEAVEQNEEPAQQEVEISTVIMK